MTQLDATIWTQHDKFAMEEEMDIGLKDANVKKLKKRTDNVTKSNKCNQCDYASSRAGNLRQHLTTHSGEKSNKCTQCDYASSRTAHLRRHLKTEKSQTDATNATLPLLGQAI